MGETYDNSRTEIADHLTTRAKLLCPAEIQPKGEENPAAMFSPMSEVITGAYDPRNGTAAQRLKKYMGIKKDLIISNKLGVEAQSILSQVECGKKERARKRELRERPKPRKQLTPKKKKPLPPALIEWRRREAEAKLRQLGKRRRLLKASN